MVGAWRVWLCVTLLTAVAWAEPYRVTTTVMPAIFEEGKTGTWQIAVTNDRFDSFSNPVFEVPSVEHLKMHFSGSKMSAQSINGVSTTTLIFEFALKAQQVGHYTIPSFSATFGKDRVKIPETRFTVVKAGQLPANGDTAAFDTTSEQVQLRVAPRVSRMYLGQCVPVDVILIATPEFVAQLRDITQFSADNADGYLLKEFFRKVEPGQGSFTQKDKAYQTLTWATTITPLKTGAQKLTLNVDVLVTKKRPLEEMDDDIHALLTHTLFGSVNEVQKMRVSSDSVTHTVLPLPPLASSQRFSGAIGRFHLKNVQLSDTKLSVGDPLTLTYVIEGEGQWLQVPPFSASPDWKYYPPKLQFHVTDTIGYAGEWTLECVLSPQRAGTLTLPDDDFIYFDPIREQYVTLRLHTDATVTVNASESQMHAVNINTESLAVAANDRKWDIATQLQHFTPYESAPEWPIFWKLQLWIACWYTVVVCVGLYWKKRWQRDGYWQKILQKQKVRRQLAVAESSAKVHDAGAFYSAALKALQYAVSSTEPEALTADAIYQHFESRIVDAAEREFLKHFLRAHEHAQYAPETERTQTLIDDCAKLKKILG